jgi:hypothetical protein
MINVERQLYLVETLAREGQDTSEAAALLRHFPELLAMHN